MDNVSDLMTPSPVVVTADAAIAACARIFVQQRFRHLPVIGADGALAGVLRDHLVFARGGLVGAQDELWVPFEEDDADLVASDLATPPTITAGPDDALRPVIAKLAGSREDVVIVLDDNRHPLGILTEHDAVRLAQDVLPDDLEIEHESTFGVAALERTHPAREAWALMEEHGFRHVVVLEHGQVTGVVSYQDLVAADVPRGREIDLAEAVVSTVVYTVPRGTPLKHVAQLMARQKIGCVPMVGERGRPRAMLTRTDVMQALVAALDAEELFAE